MDSLVSVGADGDGRTGLVGVGNGMSGGMWSGNCRSLGNLS